MKRNEFEKELDKIFLGKPRTPLEKNQDKSQQAGFLKGWNALVVGYCKILNERIDNKLNSLKSNYHEIPEEQKQKMIFTMLAFIQVHNELAEMGMEKDVEQIDFSKRIHQLFPESCLCPKRSLASKTLEDAKKKRTK